MGCLPDGPRMLVEVQGPGAGEVPGMSLGSFRVDGFPNGTAIYAGTYWPDPEDPDSGFEAFEGLVGSGGTFELTGFATDRIVGTFSLRGVSLTGESLLLTEGVLDIRYR